METNETEKKKESLLGKKSSREKDLQNFEKLNPTQIMKTKLNKKIKLRKQIEFYFSDANLVNDKFLRNLIHKDPEGGIDISIFENFNKIKEILSLVKDAEKRKTIIKKSIQMSGFLKFSKINPNKILRVSAFDLKHATQVNDEKTVYIENLNSDTTHEILINICSKIGPVLNCSIPKFENKSTKGFAFVTFENKEDAEKSLKQLNGVIPKEFLNYNQNQEVKALRLISKKEWLSKKEQFKELKKELMNENVEIYQNCASLSNNGTLKKGTIVKLLGIPESIGKNDIKLKISHFIEPQYVDLNKMKRECFVRFSESTLAEAFLKEYKVKGFELQGSLIQNIELLEGKEEENYIEKVKELKKKNKKNK